MWSWNNNHRRSNSINNETKHFSVKCKFTDITHSFLLLSNIPYSVIDIKISRYFFIKNELVKPCECILLFRKISWRPYEIKTDRTTSRFLDYFICCAINHSEIINSLKMQICTGVPMVIVWVDARFKTRHATLWRNAILKKIYLRQIIKAWRYSDALIVFISTATLELLEQRFFCTINDPHYTRLTADRKCVKLTRSDGLYEGRFFKVGFAGCTISAEKADWYGEIWCSREL